MVPVVLLFKRHINHISLIWNKEVKGVNKKNSPKSAVPNLLIIYWYSDKTHKNQLNINIVVTKNNGCCHKMKNTKVLTLSSVCKTELL